MIQSILIGIIFTGALAYLAVTIRKQFVAKNSCAKGCGCSALDLEKIENQIKQQKTIS
jgi:hypothetical protein